MNPKNSAPNNGKRRPAQKPPGNPLPPTTSQKQYLDDLRDDIAIAAMQGLVARPFSKDERDRPFVLWVAEVSYEFADAMLAERKKNR